MLPCVFMQLNGIEHNTTCVICLQRDSLHRLFGDGGIAFPGSTFPHRMFPSDVFGLNLCKEHSLFCLVLGSE